MKSLLIFLFFSTISFSQTKNFNLCLGNYREGKIPKSEVSNKLTIIHNDSLVPSERHSIIRWEVALNFVGIKGSGNTLSDELVAFIRESVHQEITIYTTVMFPDLIARVMIAKFEIVE